MTPLAPARKIRTRRCYVPVAIEVAPVPCPGGPDRLPGCSRQDTTTSSTWLSRSIDEDHGENRCEDERPSGDRHRDTKTTDEARPVGDEGTEQSDTDGATHLASRIERARGESPSPGRCGLPDRSGGRRRHQGHAESRRHEPHDQHRVGAVDSGGNETCEIPATANEPDRSAEWSAWPGSPPAYSSVSTLTLPTSFLLAISPLTPPLAPLFDTSPVPPTFPSTRLPVAPFSVPLSLRHVLLGSAPVSSDCFTRLALEERLRPLLHLMRQLRCVQVSLT